MAVTLKLNLTARRNTPLAFEWSDFTEEGVPIDFTGATAAMQVRLYGAQPGDALINLGPAAGPLSEGLTIADGAISVFIDEASLETLPAGRPGETVRFRYDLKVDLADRVDEVWIEGDFSVKPGVTDRLTLLTTDAGVFLTNNAGANLIAG